MLIFNSHSILSNSIALVCGKLNSPYFEGRSCKWKTDFDYSHVLFSYIYFFSQKALQKLQRKLHFEGKSSSLFSLVISSLIGILRKSKTVTFIQCFGLKWGFFLFTFEWYWKDSFGDLHLMKSDEMEYIHPKTSTALLSLTRKLFSSIHFVTIIGIN